MHRTTGGSSSAASVRLTMLRTHIDALAAAGATSVAFFPAPDVDIARHQLGRLLDDVIARR